MSSRWHTLAMSSYTTHLPPSEETYSFHRSTDDSSAPSNSPELPRLDSYRSSSHSSSGSSSDGLRTPPLSPNLPSVNDTKRLIVGVDDPLPFSWDDEVALQHAKEPLHPISPFRLSAPKSLAPPSAPKPAPAPSVTLTKPRKLAKAVPAPPPPTREYEEARRGRSRWPRLLWRSEVDEDALGVLEAYHQRAVGGPLPVLRSRTPREGVRKWSREMEKAGL